MPPTPEPESRPAEAIGEEPLWTCPFCPLLCDDLTPESLAVHCPRLEKALAHIAPQDPPRSSEINGQPTDPEAALKQATEILSKAHRPLFGGLTTDIAGTRALYELAARCGAILDHLHGDTLADTTRALQDRGAFFTTLSEIRSRADLIVVFACQPSQRYPRFYDRIAEPNRDVPIVFIGCNADQAAHTPHTESILPGHDPFDLLALWSAHLESSRPIPHAELATLTERIHAAHYTAFIFEPAALPAPHAALAIEALQRIVKAFNRTTRAGALALSGDDGALSVNQTTTWLSGFPLRTRVAYGMPLDHDPYRYRTHTLLSRGEIDAVLWVSSFTPEPLPAALDDNLPVIVLGHPATRLPPRKGATVFIPVATPGIDSGGHLFRIDTSVVARLTAARDSELPSVAAIAARLTQARTHP
ncbi:MULTISPECIES: formylmethanofuran dehydrogenase [unclassified Caballeronia]|uniref:formylmethanofuran dehydrogenase n=1 Tax=unclassified Caballeronia TaxID=2646786 RepID=UPI00285C32BB|nr:MULTISPECIES: formylmethanofuran dehydrogenase [unclassified Caballeronia]MDR5824390.1 formylmethanofuran dehydrogenase [Caballeronia sp. LZ043]MDR5882284.1 formylmethanofuran dehydrogenase [Caballeronia sp. LZ032]